VHRVVERHGDLKPFHPLGSRLSLCFIAKVIGLAVDVLDGRHGPWRGCRADAERDGERIGESMCEASYPLASDFVADHRPGPPS